MVTIRLATSADSDELQTLFERFVGGADWLPAGSAKDTDFMKATDGERVYVAVSQEGYLVGTLTVWQPEAFIHFLFVDSQYQGQGIGTQLLESLAPWLPFPWKLKCLATNRRALEFYRRRGWKKLETSLDAQGTYFLLGLEADGDDLP